MYLYPEKERNSKWKFTPINNTADLKFDQSLERFYKMGIKGLVRENIQNSLDASLDDRPVIVKIELGEMNKYDVPGIKDIERRIEVLKGYNSYTRETIAHMQNKIKEENIKYITFEDSNTKGLTGASKGQAGTVKDTWNVYAYNTGVHYEEDDEEREISRGGSHGVGKIASNAASDIHMMLFANCDAEGNQHLGGTVQLIEHTLDDQAYRSVGYFTDLKEEGNRYTFYPYENNFESIFTKKSRGLKIIIPYLREEYFKEKEIIKEVCDSFFIAIYKGKLEVIVNGKAITKETLKNYVFDPEYFNQDIEEMKKELTPLYLRTYLEEEPRKLKVKSISEEYDFNLYFVYDERIPTGRVAIFRTIGMKIEDFKVKSNVRKPFNAVLIGGLKEDNYLKSLENESHTKIERDHINDTTLRQEATRFINNLHKEIAKIIDQESRKINPVDGKIDTSDVLYVIRRNLKKDLEDRLNSDTKLSSGKRLIKSSGKVALKEKRDKKNGKAKKGRKTGRRQTRNPIKLQKSDQDQGHFESQVFKVMEEAVQRIVIQDEEIVRFNLNTDDLKSVSSCDIKLSIVDGMGKEYKNETNLKEHYATIVDLNTGVNYGFNRSTIKNVSVDNNSINLKMKLKDTANRNLKYIYYLEVFGNDL